MSENTKVIYWTDNLRALATIGVVLIHVTMNLVAVDINNAYWNLGNMINSLSRCSVPLFVLITGSFLLSEKKDIKLKPFLKKRLTRVLIPFIFWNLLYSLYQLKLYYGLGRSFELQDLLIQIKTHWLNGAALQLWYIYVLIGLYLFIPVINKWVRSADKNDFRYFLLLWCVSLFFLDENTSLFFTVSSFSGFIGYLILGYFLYRKDFPSKKYVLHVNAFLFVFGLLITVLGTLYLRNNSGHFKSIFYAFSSPNVALMTMSIFVFVKHCSFFNRSFKLLRVISKYSFGIYFIHIFVLWFLERFGVSYNIINPCIGIPITTILCIVTSVFCLWVMNKIPMLKKFTGVV